MITIRYGDYDSQRDFHQIFQDDEYVGVLETYRGMIRFWDHIQLEWNWAEETIIFYEEKRE